MLAPKIAPAPLLDTTGAVDFETKVTSFVAGCQKIIDDHYAESYNILPVPLLERSDGKRYVKVTKRERTSDGSFASHGGSVFCFVDKTNGDVYKPASWRAPAKHARGNIFDNHNGLQFIQWTGPCYLR